MAGWKRILDGHRGLYAHHYEGKEITATVVTTIGQTDAYNCLTTADGETPRTDLTIEQVDQHLQANGVDPDSADWR